MASKKVTILDVAREAGVSYQTVSRVINNKYDVADETRERVRQIIQTLGYRPNAAARSLPSSRTHVLGLITADFSDYFFTQVIAGAEQEARRQGYFLMLGSTERNPSDEPEYLKLLTEQRVEGILFARPSTDLYPTDSPIRSLIDGEIPVVAIACYLPGEHTRLVDVDNLDGGEQAVQCQVEAGHRMIGMITGPQGWRSVRDRATGYRNVLDRCGIPYDPALVTAGDWSYESGYQGMKMLLERNRPLTAVFAHNDQMAMGAMYALREAGLNIPQDISVVGYDDIPAAAYYYPPLTTVRQPMLQVGEVAVRQLIELISKSVTEKRQILLKPELVRRATV